MTKLPWYVTVPAVLAGLVALAPLVYLALRAAEVDLATLDRLLLRPRTLKQLTNTVSLTLGVLALSTVIALPLAWLVTRTDIRHPRLITWLAATPLAIPGYVMAHSLLGLGGYGGLLDQFFGLSVARPHGLPGAILALTLYTYPYLFLNLRTALLGLDDSLAEAAQSLGYSRSRVALRVILPQLRPALLSGWLIISLYVLGDFGVVALMRFETFSFAIYNQYVSAYDRSFGAWLALAVVLLAVLILMTEGWLMNRRRLARVGSGTTRKARLVRLGRLTPLAWAFIFVALGSALLLPVLSLAGWLALAPPAAALLSQVRESFLHSASLAVPAALIAAVWAVPLAALSTRMPGRFGKVIIRMVHLGYAVPPVALALAFVMFSIRNAQWLYQTHLIVVIAYVVAYQALAIGPVRSGLLQISTRIEEAAQALGRSPLAAFAQTTLPLLRGNILASAALVVMVTMKELPLTFMLAPTGTNTLSMRVFSRTSEGFLAEAAPFAAAIVLFSSLFVGLLIAYEGKGSSRGT